MNITALEMSDVKRIKAVRMEPSSTGLTIIGGKNANGKTSILDGIVYALGGEKCRPKNFNREGSAVPGKIRIELSNGLIVERSGKNASLKVTDPSGRKAGQKLLNEFIEPLALNLPKFLNASDKEKGETLLRIIGVGEELAELDRKESTLYSERTLVGRDADKKSKLADALEYYPDAPEELVSASELIKQQQEILARNGENQRKRERVKEITFEKHRIFDEAQRLEQQIADLQARLDERKKAYKKVTEDEEIAMKDAAQLEDESTAEIEESIANIEEINRRVRANLTKSNAMDEAKELRHEYDTMTAKIEDVRSQRKALLDGADLPLEGLGVTEGALTYNGQQWSDMSGSEQLIVATAIVRKLNPECGFVLMDKLEQMDLDTLASFGAWLEEEGLQVIATRVSTGDECSIIIEDGTVAEKQPKEEKPKFVQKAWTPGEF
ncbi:MAG: AAA family ATPase [Eubacteriales bacterium]